MQYKEEFLNLIKDLKLQYREDDKEIYIDCPLCTDTKKRLGLSKANGYWNCFNCNQKGKTAQGLKKAISKLASLGRSQFVEYKDDEPAKELKKGLGEALFQKLKESNEAKKYLIEDRKLTKECIKHFKLGCREKFEKSDGTGNYDAGLHIALPYYELDKLVNVKYRAIEPKRDSKGNLKKWRREKGGKSSLFNYNVLNDHEYHEIIIAESEIDCMSIWSLGFKNVVGLSIGAKGFKQEWSDLLERFDKVYLVLDNDEAGKDGSLALANRLGIGRCYNIVLPDDVKDPNDFLKKYSHNDFISIMKKARRFEPKNVTDLKYKITQMINSVGKPTMAATGLDTPWEPVNKILGKVNGGNLITVAAKPKAGKCLHKDSIVINPETMKPLTIEQAIKEKMSHIHSYNEETKKIEVCRISDWIDSGVKPLVRVTTQLGRSVETTYSHRYLTFDGWKFVKDIKIGEKIAVPTTFGFFGNLEKPIHIIHVIAALLADGSLTSGNCGYSKKDRELLSMMVSNLAKLKCELKHQEKHDYRIVGFSKGSNTVRDMVRKYGMNKLSKDKVIPDEIYQLKEELLVEFIGMLWSHDGSVCENKDHTSIEYSSASEKLIDGLNHLLIRFGINLKKRYKKAKLNGKEFDSWVLYSKQKDTVLKFIETFPLYGEKSKREIVVSNNTSRDYLKSYPKKIWKTVFSEAIKLHGWTPKELYMRLNPEWEPKSSKEGHRFKNKNDCSRYTLIKINKVLKSDLIQSFIDSDISFVKVTKIEDIGEHQCYDLTVPKHENFIANNIVAHNTTMVMNWLYYLSKRGIPTFNYQCEMEEEDMVIKYGLMSSVTPYPQLPEIDYDENDEPIFPNNEVEAEWHEQVEARKTWLREVRHKLNTNYLKSYHPKTEDLIDDKDNTALDKVCLKIKEVVQRFGSKVVVFDNLHFLCRGDKSKEQIDNATRRFKLLAKDLGVIFILVTHPRKTNANKALTNDDLKDSASIFQDSDAVILMHRPYLDNDTDVDSMLEDDNEGENFDSSKEGMMSPVTEIKVTARRHKGGKCYIYFNDDRALFKSEGRDYNDAMREKIRQSKEKGKKK
jgi:replicative DNA helicase